jgi:hypothetical protein
MISFPEYFQEINSHMMLAEDPETNTFSLFPPNQCDWTYTLKNIKDNIWHVSGFKNDPFSYPEQKQTNFIFELNNNEWVQTN